MNNINKDLISLLENSVDFSNNEITVLDPEKLRENIEKLVKKAVFGSDEEKGMARFLVRKIALAAGLFPASIHELYIARGKGEVPNTFTVPAINLRAISYNAARVVFRTAKKMNAGAFIFEIARSEMGYTDQRPTEYTSSILGAGIAEGYTGPVFIQGDHFQVSPKRYAEDSEAEIQAVKDLSKEAIAAGYFNIDVDTSTLVDYNLPTVPEQQSVNTKLSALFTKYIRDIEPEGVTVSIGGEIGEVGKQNSTEEELRAYMDGFNNNLSEMDQQAVGLSKISIQTGTSHGGVVLPDGSIAEVSVDFDTMLNLTRISRNDYGMGGAVQHGASTLPEDAFGKFVEAEACEVHLATNFQNIFYDHIPADFREEIYTYLKENHGNERKEGQTDEQFFYSTRKRAIGPFKAQSWELPAQSLAEIEADWDNQFTKLFTLLGIAGTKEFTDKTISRILVEPDMKDYEILTVEEEDTSDLAD